MTLREFLDRLEQAHWTHFECPVPYDRTATRVHAIGAVEVWVVDFFQDGRISAEVFGSVSRFFSPANGDPAFHVEIPQPAA